MRAAVKADESEIYLIVTHVAGLQQVKHDLDSGNQHGVEAIVQSETSVAK